MNAAPALNADAQPAQALQSIGDLHVDMVRQPGGVGWTTAAAARTLSADHEPSIADGVEQLMAASARELTIGVEAIEAAGLTLTVGTIWWAVRLSGVAGSLLATMPAWGTIDPLPILGDSPEDDDERGGDDPASMHDLAGTADDEEAAAAEVLSQRLPRSPARI